MNEKEIVNKTNLWDKFTSKFFNTHGYSTRRKFYNSLWSIFFGLLVLLVVIMVFGYNPFEVLISYFSDANKSDKFIPTIAAFVFASLAIAISFKAGIFNIGISGQMMISGIITLYFLRSSIEKTGAVNNSSILISILLSLIISIVASLLIGVLKAYLGVNEVVSSIMINWIIFFIIVYAVKSNADGLLTNSTLISQGKTEKFEGFLPDFFYIEYAAWYTSPWSWTLIVLAVIAAIIIWGIIKFTKFGYKIKMVGLSQTASDYSGTNKKSLIMIIMTISGLLSGIAGFIWYFSVTFGEINVNITSGPLYVGFNAIAVSLIVFDNPIAILFSSILFSIISVGTTTASQFPGLPKEMVDVISGIFIYSAALAFVFSKFVPYEWTKNFITLVRYKKYREKYWTNWKEFFVYYLLFFNEKVKLFNLWKNHHKEWTKIKKEIIQKRKKTEVIYFDKLKKENQESHVKKFNFKVLDNNNQIEYLNFLAKLKKEQDHLLAEQNYFERNKIKQYRKERYYSWRNNYNHLKKSILDEHYNIVEEELYDSTSELAAKERKRLEEKNKKGGK